MALTSTSATVLAAFASGAVFLTRDAWSAPSTRWVGSCCDPEQTMWYLRWVPYAFAHGTDPFVTHLANAPDGVNLMWNTPTLLIGLVAAPITLLAGPIVAYDVVMTAAIALSAWCAFLAIRRYASGWFAPFVGGAVYGFSPYVVPHAALHLDLTFAAIPPLFLLVLDDLVVRRRRPPVPLGIALGILSFVQLLTEEEVLATAVIVAGILVAVLALQRRGDVGAAAPRLRAALLAATVTFVVLAAWPLAVQFAGPQRVHGSLQDAEAFSTDLLNLVVPTGYQLVAPGAATSVSDHFSGLTHEANAYIGFPLLLTLAAFVARAWADIRVRTATIVGAIALVLSLGPHLHIAGASTGWPLPWLPLTRVPLLQDAQPNRLVLFAWMAAAVLVAVAVEAALRLEPARRVAAAAGLAVALAAILPAQLASSTTPIPAFFERWADEGIPDGTIVMVAPFFRDGAGADPMLWAAVAGDGIAMPEAFAFVPTDAGTPQYGPTDTQLSSVMEAIQDKGQTIVARGDVRAQIARDLRDKGIRDVIVGPMDHHDEMVGFFTDLFGREAGDVDGVRIWRDVDRQGVAPAKP